MTITGFSGDKTTVKKTVYLRVVCGKVGFSTDFSIVQKEKCPNVDVILGKPALVKMGVWRALMNFADAKLEIV